MNVLLLSKNYSRYKSGYYHDDIVSAWRALHNCYVWGPGYEGYIPGEPAGSVLSRAIEILGQVDLIVCSTSWDNDTSVDSVDPDPKLKLADFKDIPVIYYLNKEYKKLDRRLDYIRNGKVDYVVTVHPSYNEWESLVDAKWIKTDFAVNLERFSSHISPKTYDFGFTGSLHRSHNDLRFLAKEEVFCQEHMARKTNLTKFRRPRRSYLLPGFSDLNVYWAEFGSSDFLGRSLLPFGDRYARFLSKFKVFLNTPSATGIFNTRFFELMAAGTLILCPRGESYQDILKDGDNCIMYNPGLLEPTLREILNDQKKMSSIVARSKEMVSFGHTYQDRVKKICSVVDG